MIQGVVFDLFGTLIPCPDLKTHYEMLGEMADVVGMKEDAYADMWHETNSLRMTGTGGSSLGFMEHMFDLYDHKVNREKSMEVVRIYDRYASDLMTLFPDVPPVLEELNGKRIKIGLLTNCGINVPGLFESIPESRFFHSRGYSSHIGFKKPDPEIFKWSIKNMRIPPSSTIYVGDGDSGELEGAERAGMNPVKIERGEANGDYRLTPLENWDPTINDMNDLLTLIGDL